MLRQGFFQGWSAEFYLPLDGSRREVLGSTADRLLPSLSHSQGNVLGRSSEGGPAAEWEPVCDLDAKGPTRWIHTGAGPRSVWGRPRWWQGRPVLPGPGGAVSTGGARVSGRGAARRRAPAARHGSACGGGHSPGASSGTPVVRDIMQA